MLFETYRPCLEVVRLIGELDVMKGAWQFLSKDRQSIRYSVPHDGAYLLDKRSIAAEAGPSAARSGSIQ